LVVLKEHERKYVSNVFKFVNDEVTLSLFRQDHESQSERETRQILEELSSISDRITLRIFDSETDQEKFETYQVDKLPCVVIEGIRDFGIRYFGVPGGYLVSSLIEDVIQISKKESDLKDHSKKRLKEVLHPLNLQVFVTPTSPYCPALVNLSHRMALENNNISAHAVNITEYPHLAMRYNITDVPFTIVNHKIPIEGALDENDYIEKIMQTYRKIEKII
jgi:glutaredoxin-like protein